MPLSEHEQRVLRQIERQLRQERSLGRPLWLPADPEQAARNAKWAALGFFVGLAALLASFASSWVIGLVGFLIMLASAALFVQCLRRLARQRWGQPDPAGADPSANPARRHSGERKWRPGWAGSQHDDEQS